MQKGFTLIELIVVIATIAVLSGIVLFSVNQYISKGKDSNIYGNLAVLVPAGEVFYNGNADYPNTYRDFCNIENSAIKNAISQMPKNSKGSCYLDATPASGNISLGNPAGLCCNESAPLYQEWAACVPKLSDSNAYCVDSRGVKKEISVNDCNDTITKCP